MSYMIKIIKLKNRKKMTFSELLYDGYSCMGIYGEYSIHKKDNCKYLTLKCGNDLYYEPIKIRRLK